MAKEMASMNTAEIKEYLKLTNPRFIQLKATVVKTTASTIVQS